MASKMSDKMHILANKRVQNILSWVTKEHVKEGVSVTEENKCT